MALFFADNFCGGLRLESRARATGWFFGLFSGIIIRFFSNAYAKKENS